MNGRHADDEKPKQRNSSAYLFIIIFVRVLQNPKTLDCHNRNFIDADPKKRDFKENMTTSVENTTPVLRSVLFVYEIISSNKKRAQQQQQRNEQKQRQ